jgi:putative ABC transport system ATP-binding protein
MSHGAGESALVLALRNVVCELGERERFTLFVDRFEVRRGEAVALAGPSGSGKSTIMNLLALARRPVRAGHFHFFPRVGDGYDIGALWSARDDDCLTTIRAAHLGYVLQQGGLLPYLSVRQNISLSQTILGEGDPRRVEDIAVRLEIDKLLDRSPSALSVGQRQRAAIARALVHRPDLVLADEPTASVHPSIAADILGLLVEQCVHDDATVVLATHDPELADRKGFEIVDLNRIGRAADGEHSTLSRGLRSEARDDR